MSVLATDNFDRADEVPVNAPWVTGTAGSNYWKISVNEFVRGDTDFDSWAYYDGSVSWPNDQYSKGKVFENASNGGGQGVGLMVRKASGQTNTYYRFVVDHAATNNCELAKIVAGTYTQIVQFTQAWTDADVWELRVSGTTLSMYLNGVQKGGNQTDNAIASGFPGVAYSSTDGVGKIDDWEGGDVAAAVIMPRLIVAPRIPPTRFGFGR